MAEEAQTELDKALAYVRDNPDDIHVFYNTFLNSLLYLPTHDEINSEGTSSEGSDKQLKPIFSQSGDTLYLMIFDTLERLSAWAKKDLAYVGLQGATILELMDTRFHWYLNYGSENGRAFSSDEIAWLKSAVQRATQSEMRISRDEDEVQFSDLTPIPDGLTDVLKRLAESTRELKEVALGGFFMQGKMGRPDLALAIRAVAMAEDRKQFIIQSFTDAARDFLDESEEFWVFVDSDTDLADRMLEKVKPFYIGTTNA